MAIDAAALNALTTQWAIAKADLDDRENRTRINYNNVLNKMNLRYKDATKSAGEVMADRGMTHSGAAVAGSAKMNTDYTRSKADAAQATNLDIATIARKRLEQDRAYQAQKLVMQMNALQPVAPK